MLSINLLLVGRTGNGKSSTGNSILHKKAFTPRSVTSSIVYDIMKESSEINNTHVNVIDGPGLGDTTTDITEDGQSMIELTKKAFDLSSSIFHALLVVFKYGTRFTNQEKDAVKMIRAMFGEDVFKRYGIIILTHGDSFDMDVEGEDTTFQAWCEQQTGDVQTLFAECNMRCLLFDNKSKDQQKLINQVEQLLEMVANISRNSAPYCKDDFNKAESGRVKLLVLDKLPELNSRTDSTLNDITKHINQIGKQDGDYENNIYQLKELSKNLKELKDYLQEQDQGTNVIASLMIRISVTEVRMKTMLDLQEKKLQIAQLSQDKTIKKKELPPAVHRPNIVSRILVYLRGNLQNVFRSKETFLIHIALVSTGYIIFRKYYKTLFIATSVRASNVVHSATGNPILQGPAMLGAMLDSLSLGAGAFEA